MTQSSAVNPGAGPRAPEHRRSAPIARLESLPAFLKMEGRIALVCGDGPGAAWKCELLAAAGAKVRAYSKTPGDELRGAAQQNDLIHLEMIEPQADDFKKIFVAVIDSEDFDAIAKFSRMARAAGALVNVVDKPDFCDFSFGSIVNRSPLVVGIATGGAAPVFGQAIRARLETLLPQSFAAWAQLAKAVRPRVSALALPFRSRRAFWEFFVDRAFSGDPVPTTERQIDDLVAQGLSGAENVTGRIILVGAGPGDPDLLTLKAVRALQKADVVLFDDLAPERVLELARREAQRISVGKRGHAPSVGQKAISQLLVELALQGKTVVRLKGGDPNVFGRANEEIAAALAAGIPCEVVPGVTAALAAAAAVRASLSERERARRIQFITAHSADGALPEGMEWRALVDRDAATAVYMGVRTLPALVERLLREGLDPATPAIIVESASTEGERHLAGRIADMPAIVAEARPTGPCILLYGQTLDRAAPRPWTANPP